MPQPTDHLPRAMWALLFVGYSALFGMVFTSPQWHAVGKARIEAAERVQLVAALADAVREARQIETRKAVVETDDRRADGTFFNPAHPGTHEPAVSVRRVFTTASGLDYNGRSFSVKTGTGN